MIRDPLKDSVYFEKWMLFYESTIDERKRLLQEPSGNPGYRPQYVYSLLGYNLSLLLQHYCHGDPIRELAQYIPPMLDAWEEAERLGKDVWKERQQYTRHSWVVNLDHYINCFWLVGLALSLEIPEVQWQRLLLLIGNEGEDALLDRIIATRQPGRRVGAKLCHPKPYQRLLETINAPADQQPQLLYTFVQKWYAELNRPQKKGLSEDVSLYEQPYWYKYHTLEGGYFGYWCIEAVAAVKAFGLDDQLCLGHPNYPGDLLRPDKPTTHPVKMDEAKSGADGKCLPCCSQQKTGWLAGLFGMGKLK